MDAGPHQRPRAPLCTPGPLHPLVWHRAPLRRPRTAGRRSIRIQASRATIERVKCRPIENRPCQTQSFAASKALIAGAHDANLPRAVLDAVKRPRSPVSRRAKPQSILVERYFRKSQLIVAADAPRFAIRRTPQGPGPHSCRSAAAGSIFIARRAGA
jgi:hypothetical protein